MNTNLKIFLIRNRNGSMNKNKIKYYITKFLKGIELESRFLIVEFYFKDDSSLLHQLNKAQILDRNNPISINKYISQIQQNFKNKTFENKLVKAIIKYNEIPESHYFDVYRK